MNRFFFFFLKRSLALRWKNGLVEYMTKGLQVGGDGGLDEDGGKRAGEKWIVLKTFNRQN